MKEEDILLKKLGKENSFKVPDGYFENLTSEVMNKLPEKEKVVNELVSMEVIVRICRKLNCGIEDIMQVLPETRERS